MTSTMTIKESQINLEVIWNPRTKAWTSIEEVHDQGYQTSVTKILKLERLLNGSLEDYPDSGGNKQGKQETVNRLSIIYTHRHGISNLHIFDSSHHHPLRLAILCTHHSCRWLETTWPQKLTWPQQIVVVGVQGVADESSNVLCIEPEIVPL